METRDSYLGLSFIPAECNLFSIERPRAELHFTFLLVERKIFYVDDARALIDGDRNPHDLARVVDDYVRFIRHFVLAVGATHDDQKIYSANQRRFIGLLYRKWHKCSQAQSLVLSSTQHRLTRRQQSQF